MNDEERKKAGIKKAGQLMLQGWIMLAEHCPVCYSVLFSNKAKTECVCPTCDLPVKKESELNKNQKEYYESSPVVVPVSTPTPIVTQNKEEKVTVSEEEGEEEDYDCYEDDIELPESLEELKLEWEKKMKVRDEASTKIGEYMLTGWSMLATTCTKYKENHPEAEGVILVGKGDVIKCVACEHKIGYVEPKKSSTITDTTTSASTASIGVVPNVTQPQLTPPPRSTIDSIPMQTQNQNQTGSVSNTVEIDLIDKASGLIGTYLLKGYSLLDCTCSNVDADCCGKVPLVQKNGSADKICVMCVENKKNNINNNINTATITTNSNHNTTSNIHANLNSESLDDDSDDVAYRFSNVYNTATQKQQNNMNTTTTASATNTTTASVVAPHTVTMQSSGCCHNGTQGVCNSNTNGNASLLNTQSVLVQVSV